MLNNKSLNMLHLHYFLIRMGEFLTNIFGIVVLFKLGYELYLAFLLWSLMFVFRLFLRPLLLPIMKKIGVFNTVKIGTVLYIFLYPVFYLVSTDSISVLIYVFYFAVTVIFYWLSFHTIYGLIGDNDKRGRQSAVREAYAKVAYVASPVIGGYVLSLYDFFGFFFVGSLFFVLSLLPLSLIKKPKEVQKTQTNFKKGFRSTSKIGFFTSSSFAFFEAFFVYVWAVVIFFILGEDVFKLGVLFGVVIFLRILIEYLIGRSIDLKSTFKWYYIGFLILSISIILRVFYAHDFISIIIVDAVFALGYSIFIPYESVLIYNSIKNSKHPEWFTLISESGWDIGSILAFSLISVLLLFSVDLRSLMFIGIIGIFTCTITYNRYYKHSRYCAENHQE